VRRSVLPVARGSALGFFMGLLPGPSTTIASFLAYSVERKLSRAPESFGHGAVEGVVGPESANNSAVMGSMIPLLTLGIPFAAPSAIMLAGLRMHNVEPGPMLFVNNAQVFWTFIATMLIANVILLVLNLPLVGLFARISVLRPQLLMPVISLICLVGVYSVRNSMFDVCVMIAAGVAGFLLRRWQFPIAPLIIGLVLGPTTENSVRQTLMMFRGDMSLIFERATATILLGLAAGVLAFMLISRWRGRRVALVVADDKSL
jgi:putative tricarboxylic transport membrane protein